MRHVHARCHFHKALQLLKSSFASLVGGTCGPSPENPNVVHFVDLKNSDCDVKAHLKCCNIVTDAESVNSERKLLLAHAGK